MNQSRRSGLTRRIKPAPKLAIRRQLPRSARVMLIVAPILVVCAVAWLAYGLGRGMAPFERGPSLEQAQQLQRRIAILGAERDRMAGGLSGSESQLAIERAAKQQLASQLKALEIENAQLQEDLSFFETLLPAGPVSQDILIRRMKFDVIAPDQLRYRILIMRHGKAEQDFHGNLQLSAELAGSGTRGSLIFPAKNDANADQFKLGFRHYERIEGILKLPQGSQVKSVRASVYENGKLRSQQSANL